MSKKKIQELADQLEQVTNKHSEAKQACAEILDPLKEQEELLREELAVAMYKENHDDIDTSTGLRWHLNKGRVSFKVKKGCEKEALDWAMKDYPSLLSLTAAKVNTVVAPMLNPPLFFDRIDGDPYVAISRTEK